MSITVNVSAFRRKKKHYSIQFVRPSPVRLFRFVRLLVGQLSRLSVSSSIDSSICLLAIYRAHLDVFHLMKQRTKHSWKKKEEGELRKPSPVYITAMRIRRKTVIDKQSLLSHWTVDQPKSVRLMKPTHKHDTAIIWTPAGLRKNQSTHSTHSDVYLLNSLGILAAIYAICGLTFH